MKFIRIICYIAIAFIIFFIILGNFDDGTENLGGGYSYDYSASKAIYGPQIDIPPFIANFNYDERFIIVKQVLNGLLPERIFWDDNDYNYPFLSGDFYWIIDKQANMYYGPLELDDFKHKCDSLKVKIKLSPKDKFKQ